MTLVCPICGWETRSAAEMIGHMTRHKRFALWVQK